MFLKKPVFNTAIITIFFQNSYKMIYLYMTKKTLYMLLNQHKNKLYKLLSLMLNYS